MRQEVSLLTSEGRHQFVIDDDFCSSCGVSPDNYDGTSLFIVSWLALLSDSPLNSVTSRKPRRLYTSFLRYIQAHGLRNVVIEFSNISHKLMSQHMLMGQSTPMGDWIDDFKNTPVFFEYNRYFNTGDPLIVNYLYTFLCFGKKLEYVDSNFDEVAFRNWLGIEEKLANLSLTDTDCTALSSILRIVLPRFSVDGFYPKYGPGSVAERGVRGRIAKTEIFQYDRVIDRFLFHGYIGKYGYGKESGSDPIACVPNIDNWTPDKRPSSRVARLMFVPKDLKVSRSICLEPNTIQYFQQGILSVMLELVGKSPFSKFIRLEDQARNRSLAHIGSYTSCIDTIDLSSASDCLSLELVKRILPPSWQIPMLACRSHSCITPEGIHSLKKFAPMGSALCFPTQCILFASVVAYAACLRTYDFTPYSGTLLDFVETHILDVISNFGDDVYYMKDPTKFSPCAIYGDDICCDKNLTAYVYAILDRLGFIINYNKSFTGSQSFRESCGGFYLDGIDVTPIYYRVKGVRQRLTGECLASMVSLINSSFLRGYTTLYSCLKRILMSWDTRFRNELNCIPFIEPLSDSFGIFSQRPINSHLQKRWNADLQRDEYKVMSVSYNYKTCDSDIIDSYEYMRWMGNHVKDISGDDSTSHLSYDTGGARIVWRWMPAID